MNNNLLNESLEVIDDILLPPVLVKSDVQQIVRDTPSLADDYRASIGQTHPNNHLKRDIISWKFSSNCLRRSSN